MMVINPSLDPKHVRSFAKTTVTTGPGIPATALFREALHPLTSVTTMLKFPWARLENTDVPWNETPLLLLYWYAPVPPWALMARLPFGFPHVEGVATADAVSRTGSRSVTCAVASQPLMSVTTML